MSIVAGDKVSFLSVPGAYKAGENVVVKYEIDANFETTTRDWVGVFCVGWSSNRDYYTFEWVVDGGVKDSVKTVYQVKFSGSRLPPEDGHFYQFCYVTRNGVVKGASRPFQFTKSVNDAVNDLDDLVEVNEDESLLVLRTRHEAQISELREQVNTLSAANVSFEAVKSDRDELKDKYERNVALLEASQVEVANLKEIVEAKEELVQCMVNKADANDTKLEELQKEVDQLRLSNIGKDEESQGVKKLVESLSNDLQDKVALLDKLQKDIAEKDSQIQELGVQITILVDDRKISQGNEQSLREKCTQLEQENRELLENKEMFEVRLKYKDTEIAGLEEQVEALKAQVVSLEEEGNELASELEKQAEEKKKLMETARIKEQEANLAQQNLCEILGNINEPRDLLNRQGSVENVDKSALEALQLAYADIEKRWKVEHKSNAQLKNKTAELEERINVCRQEYEAIYIEASALKKELKKVKTGGVQSQGSDEAIVLLQKEYERLQLDLEEFQIKHDQRMSEKSTQIEELVKQLNDKDGELEGRRVQEDAMKRSIESLNAEIGQLKSTNHDLVQKLERITANRQHRDALVTSPPYNPGYPPLPGLYHPQPSAPSPRQPHGQLPRSNANIQSKECPMCGESYPLSMNQKDFETHVQSHF